jgi:hypothetical protein
MGELTDLAGRLRSDSRVSGTRFNSMFLEDVGNVLEQRGFAEARLFVWDHRNRTNLEKQVQALLIILEEMEKVHRIDEDKALGRYIIKNKLRLLVDTLEPGARKR